MDLRPLGSTGIQVSPLGLGTVKIGRNQQVKYPSLFAIPDDRAVAELLALARDLFAGEPNAYVLAIRGQRFGEFSVGLSPEAETALAGTLEYLTARIRDGFAHSQPAGEAAESSCALNETG